jgi:hypothetical protein
VGSGALALDTVLSSLWWALGKWTPQLTRNRSDRLLRLLTLKLHGASRGDLFHAHIQASQEALAHELGLSREWVNKLLARLKAAGWIDWYAPRLPDGHFLPAVFRAGGQLKRLLCVLLRYRRPRPSSHVNDRSPSLPPPKEVREQNLHFWLKLKADLSRRVNKG